MFCIIAKESKDWKEWRNNNKYESKTKHIDPKTINMTPKTKNTSPETQNSIKNI